MAQKFHKLNIKHLNDNVFKLLDNDWMLVTAGSLDSNNTMTASWGCFGILWNKPIAICFIRPQRYTLDFVNKASVYTLSFFSEKYRDVLNLCGSQSGRKINKIKQAGLTPALAERGGILFEEARLVLECKKLYADSIKPDNFIQETLIKEIYPHSDFHYFFIGEIVNCYSSEIAPKETPDKYEETENESMP